MKRILITGAAGKIGSLLRKGPRGFAAQSSRRIRRALSFKCAGRCVVEQR